MRSVSPESGPAELTGNTAVGFPLERGIFAVKIVFIPGRVTQLGADGIASQGARLPVPLLPAATRAEPSLPRQLRCCVWEQKALTTGRMLLRNLCSGFPLPTACPEGFLQSPVLGARLTGTALAGSKNCLSMQTKHLLDKQGLSSS